MQFRNKDEYVYRTQSHLKTYKIVQHQNKESKSNKQLTRNFVQSCYEQGRVQIVDQYPSLQRRDFSLPTLRKQTSVPLMPQA